MITLLAITVWAASVNASGTVTYVAGADAFLDVGRAQGVTAGALLKASRRKKPVGTCDVVEVSATNARCHSDKLRPGDRVSFEVVPLPAKPKVKPREPLPDDVDLAEERDVVMAAPLPMVKHEKTSAAGIVVGGRASATLREEVWATSTTPNGAFARTTIDGGARAGIDVSPWVKNTFVTFGGAIRVVGDLIAPVGQQEVNLYLWNASVAAEGGVLVAELGRFRPRLAPGASMMDGAQAGIRLLDGALEFGAFAGTLPDLLTTSPSADRLTAGAYVGADVIIAPGVVVLPRARVAAVGSGDLTTLRGELEGQAQLAWQNIGIVGASARAGASAAGDLSLDGARLDGDVLVTPELRTRAGYRYLSPLVVDLDLASAKLPVGGAHHLSAGASYTIGALVGDALGDFGKTLTVGGLLGGGYDVVTTVSRGYIGPEVGMPSAFGTWGGLDLGYLEELGGGPFDLGGRSAWLTAHVLPPVAVMPGLRVVTRVSYLELNALGDELREAGLMVLADMPIVPLVPWLSLRARTYLQQALPSADGATRSTSSILYADVAFTGTL